MSAPEISSAAAEPIAFTWFQNGAPVTGGSPTMRVSRYSDSYTTVLDWSTGAFVAPASAVLPYVALAQVSATYNAGLYFREFDLAAIVGAVAPDIYRIAFYGDNTLDLPLDTGEIRVGTVDTIDDTAATAATLATSAAVAAVKVDTGLTVDALYNARAIDESGGITQYADNGVTPAFTATGTDVNGDPVTIAPGTVARTTKLTAVP